MRKKKYEHHRGQFKGRNSYSKTDPDATFMRMKEDHMQNGQLKPGYNIQVGTENGFVVSFKAFENPTDTKTLKPQLINYQNMYGKLPEAVIADKGYGSLENYEELENKNIEAYIKYPHWSQEKKKRSRKYRYRSWRFIYDHDNDQFACPEGEKLDYVFDRKRKKWNGKTEDLKVYECKGCQNCRERMKCTKRDYRRIEVNHERLRLQQKARDRLKTEVGWRLYRKRGSEVETVFGQIKGNQGFRRFYTLGKNMITCEWGIHMIGYNIKNLFRLV